MLSVIYILGNSWSNLLNDSTLLLSLSIAKRFPRIYSVFYLEVLSLWISSDYTGILVDVLDSSIYVYISLFLYYVYIDYINYYSRYYLPFI